MKTTVTTDLTKQQFQKLMRRPSMSELEGDLARENRRNENALRRESTSVDRQAKMQMTLHRKKSQDFLKTQSDKLTGSSPRRSLDSTVMNSRMSGSFQKLSVLDPQSERGSLPFHSGPLPGTPWYNQQEFPTTRRRRHSESVLKTNKSLAIRHRLYREFNMPEKSKRHRPWSPSYCLSMVERAHQNINRRLSEPFSKPTEGLSDEIKEKLAYITGEKPRNSISMVPLSEPANNAADEQVLIDGEPVTGPVNEIIQPTPPATKPDPTEAKPRQRRVSEVLRQPIAQPKLHRRLSESISRPNAGLLPPLEENI